MTGADEPEDGGFLRGWSRRKLAAKKPAVAPPAPPDNLSVEPERPTLSEQVDDAYIAALPPIASIVEGTDIKPFLARGVPGDLRNAALRKLWSATPGVRDYVDPAVDYAWDWNAPGGVPGGGGTLSQGRVAQMVKDLIGGQQTQSEDDPQKSPVADGSPDTNRAEDNAEPVNGPQDKKEGAPQAVRTSASKGNPQGAVTSENPTKQRAGKQQSDPLPPPKRHGGAVPT
jgi:hypothetical protein